MAVTSAAAEPVLIDTAGVARLLGISKRHVNRLDAAGSMPSPLCRRPRLKRWKRSVILQWIDRGLPSRGDFEAATVPGP